MASFGSMSLRLRPTADAVTGPRLMSFFKGRALSQALSQATNFLVLVIGVSVFGGEGAARFALAYSLMQLVVMLARVTASESVIADVCDPTLSSFRVAILGATALAVIAPWAFGTPILLGISLSVASVVLEAGRSLMLRRKPVLASCGELIFLGSFVAGLFTRLDASWALALAIAVQAGFLARPNGLGRSLPIRSQGYYFLEFALGRGLAEGLVLLAAWLQPSELATLKVAQVLAGFILVAIAATRVWALGRFGEIRASARQLRRYLWVGCLLSISTFLVAVLAMLIVVANRSRLPSVIGEAAASLMLLTFFAGAAIRFPEAISTAYLRAADYSRLIAGTRILASVVAILVFALSWPLLGAAAVPVALLALSTVALVRNTLAASRAASSVPG